MLEELRQLRALASDLCPLLLKELRRLRALVPELLEPRL
jgi:hypothetical protein